MKFSNIFDEQVEVDSSSVVALGWDIGDHEIVVFIKGDAVVTKSDIPFAFRGAIRQHAPASTELISSWDYQNALLVIDPDDSGRFVWIRASEIESILLEQELMTVFFGAGHTLTMPRNNAFYESWRKAAEWVLRFDFGTYSQDVLASTINCIVDREDCYAVYFRGGIVLTRNHQPGGQISHLRYHYWALTHHLDNGDVIFVRRNNVVAVDDGKVWFKEGAGIEVTNPSELVSQLRDMVKLDHPRSEAWVKKGAIRRILPRGNGLAIIEVEGGHYLGCTLESAELVKESQS